MNKAYVAFVLLKKQIQNIFMTNLKVSNWKTNFSQLMSKIWEDFSVTDGNYRPKNSIIANK